MSTNITGKIQALHVRFCEGLRVRFPRATRLINEAVNQEQHAIHTFKIEGLADQARFVRLQTISGGYYVFVDEIEVLGSKKDGLKPQDRKLTPDSFSVNTVRFSVKSDTKEKTFVQSDAIID